MEPWAWTKEQYDKTKQIWQKHHQKYHVYIQERDGSNVHLGDIVAWDWKDARRQAVEIANLFGWDNPQRVYLDRM